MGTMRAITFEPGGPDNLRLAEVPIPEPGPTEVLIRTAAAGVNPVDWKTRTGSGVFGMFPVDAPRILGWDVAGTVARVGAGVTRFRVGDRVFGMPRFPRPAGCYAEYITSRSRQVAGIPEEVDDVSAAAVPLAGLTAWQSIVDTLAVGPGHRILIHAGAGGVGHLAVQLAAARGARVWATASAPKHDLLRELGVDHPIDHRTRDFADAAQGMDSVLDLVGTGAIPSRSLRCLRPGGELLVIPSAGGLPDADEVAAARVGCRTMLVEPDHGALEQIGSMMAGGQLRVLVERTAPLQDMAELHRRSESGRTTGKLVAIVGDLR